MSWNVWILSALQWFSEELQLDLWLVQDLELVDSLLVLVWWVPGDVETVGWPCSHSDDIHIIQCVNHAGSCRGLLLLSSAKLSKARRWHACHFISHALFWRDNNSSGTRICFPTKSDYMVLDLFYTLAQDDQSSYCHSEETKTSIIFSVSIVENFFCLIQA